MLFNSHAFPKTFFLCKKDITVDYWGWRYLSEETKDAGSVYFHGFNTAVLTKGEDQFIVSVGHYGRATGDSKFAEEHNAAIQYAATKAGVDITNTPVIITGDMFTYDNKDDGAAGYKYWVSQGYSDSQISATVCANSSEGCLGSNNRRHGTFHDPGVRTITGVSEDFIWHNSGLSALTFKVLVSEDIDDCSDHYPVIADLQFN